LLLAGATTLLYLAIDEQQIEAALAERVSRELDATLSIDGNFAIAVLPAPSIQIDDIRLRAPAGSDAVLAAARSVQLRVSPWPLLRGELAVDELTIRGLSIDASRDAAGRGNWEIRRSAEAAAPVAASPTNTAAGAAAAPLLLAMDRVRIEDATIRYRDERSATQQELRRLDLLADGLNLQGQPFRIEGRGELLLDGAPHELRLDSGLNLGSEELALIDTTIAITPAGGRAIELHAGAGTWRYADSAAALTEVSLSSGSLRGTGSLRYTPGTTRRIEVRFDIPELDLDELLAGNPQARDARAPAAETSATAPASAPTFVAVPVNTDIELSIGHAVRRELSLRGVKASLALRAEGAIPASLSGPARLSIEAAELRELSVEELVCKAAATLNKEPLTARFDPLTRAAPLLLELDFANGIGSVRTLTATLPVMQLDGSGHIDLPRRRLALQLGARITGDLEARDRACRMTRKMQRVSWPIACNTSLDAEPAKWCSVDKDALGRIAGEFAGQKLGDKLKDKLGEFFRRN
jgi:hypothetical protein